MQAYKISLWPQTSPKAVECQAKRSTSEVSVPTEPIYHSLFIKKSDKGTTIVVIYVDDMLITGDQLELIEDTKNNIRRAFKMKDLAELKYFLGIEFAIKTRNPHAPKKV